MYSISTSDLAFKTAFETCVMSPSDFTHRAHLRLAYVYLADNDVDASINLMRTALQTFLTHYGVPPEKYHETVTAAWIMAVNHFMHQGTGADCADVFIDAHPVLAEKDIMLTHYSKEILFSDEARQLFVAPNLDPIPTYG